MGRIGYEVARRAEAFGMNQYRNRVQPGLSFVYYRGVRRSDGKRGAAEYFGSGVIGEVWVDPEQPADTPARNRRWFCAIEEYKPFHVPVHAKHAGKPYENIKTAMGWRTGVREITYDIFNRIIEAAWATRGGAQTKRTSVADAKLSQAEPSELLINRPLTKSHSGYGLKPPSRGLRQNGAWAEELVYRWLSIKLETGERDTLESFIREAGSGVARCFPVQWMDGMVA